MADKSAIEWTDATWNPIVGCSIVTPGCTNCYAMTMAARIDKMTLSSHYKGLTRQMNGKQVWTGKMALSPAHIITAPLRWKRPRRIFVNSMGDLFHEDVPDEWIDKIFAVMALCPQHAFQVLTKRSMRMRKYCSNEGRYREMAIDRDLSEVVSARDRALNLHKLSPFGGCNPGLPLPNVWLGVSAEDQTRANERISNLLETPAAVRFVSAEPLLGSIDFTCIFAPQIKRITDPRHRKNSILIEEQVYYDALCGVMRFGNIPTRRRETLDWVIAGGESGPHARPMHPDWARSIRDQCADVGVPFFFKQWGEWLPWDQFSATDIDDDPEQTRFITQEFEDGRWRDAGYPMWCDSTDGNVNDDNCVGRVGKKRAGRLLDGVEHNGYPECHAPPP